MAITKLFLKTSPDERKKLWQLYSTKANDEGLPPEPYILYYAEGFLGTESELARDYLKLAPYEKELRDDLSLIQESEHNLSEYELLFLEGAVALCDYFKDKREEKLVIEEALEPVVDSAIVEACGGDYKTALTFTKAITPNMPHEDVADLFREITGKERPDNSCEAFANGLKRMGKQHVGYRTWQRDFKK